MARSLFYGKKVYLRYEAISWCGQVQSIKNRDKYDYVLLSACDVDKPLLEVGEKFYLNEIEEVVVIEEAIRTSGGEVRYHTTYIVETVEDEETEKSKKSAEEKVEENRKWREERSKKYHSEEDLEKKWYQFWK